jgi:NAD(P)-dependent dehydrogenase (short-subunit alcohol dehydrogenase family)
MSKPFDGRVVLITGSGNGIGKATARELAARGAVVGINDLKPEFVEKACAEIATLGGKAIPIVQNVATRDGMRAAVLGLSEKAGRFDGLVNNAAWVRYQAVPDIQADTMERMLDIGFKAIVWGIQAAAEVMDPVRGGAIVNIASTAGFRSTPSSVVYSGIKAGIMGLTRAQYSRQRHRTRGHPDRGHDAQPQCRARCGPYRSHPARSPWHRRRCGAGHLLSARR